MMNEQDKMLNKFEFDKMWEIRTALVVGRSNLECRYKDTGYQWIKDQMNEIDNAMDTLDELNDFLCTRSMIKYQDPDIGNNEPHLKTVH